MPPKKKTTSSSKATTSKTNSSKVAAKKTTTKKTTTKKTTQKPATKRRTTTTKKTTTAKTKAVASQTGTKAKKKEYGFFESIGRSVYGPDFYAKVRSYSFGKGFAYFLAVSFMTTLLGAIWLGATVIGEGKEWLEENYGGDLSTLTEEIYPEDLVISVENGEVVVNQEEPYFIDFPGEIQESFEEEMGWAHLVVIDTETPFSVNAMQDYETWIWVTEDSFIMWKDNYSSQVNVLDLSEMEGETLDKEKFDSLVNEGWTAVRNAFWPIVVIVFIGAYIGLVLWRLFYNLILAVLMLVLATVMNVKLSYGQAYVMGFYAMTLALFLSILIPMTAAWTGFAGFGMMFTLITLIVAGINLHLAKREGLLKD